MYYTAICQSIYALCSRQWVRVAMSSVILTFDHADVVSTVADSQSDALAMSFDEVDNERLLQRSDAATKNSLTTSCYVQQ